MEGHDEKRLHSMHQPLKQHLDTRGTDFSDALVEIIIVGRVIKVNTITTNGADCGKCIKLIKTAKPKMPNTIEGTAAKFDILTSITSVIQLRGANSSR